MADRAGLSTQARDAIAKRTISTVASRAFGLIVHDDGDRHEYVDHLLHANDRLPAEKTGEYVTLYDNQTAIRLQIMEQAGAVESAEPGDNDKVAEGRIAIPQGKPRGWPIDVTFRLDRSGLLHVTAIEREAGERVDLQAQITFTSAR
jgi:molecular chaperone DnaK (HSP70)